MVKVVMMSALCAWGTRKMHVGEVPTVHMEKRECSISWRKRKEKLHEKGSEGSGCLKRREGEVALDSNKS